MHASGLGKAYLAALRPRECAAIIDLHYAGRVAWVAQGVFNRPVHQVCVLPRGLSHNNREQPV